MNALHTEFKNGKGFFVSRKERTFTKIKENETKQRQQKRRAGKLQRTEKEELQIFKDFHKVE